LAISKQFTLGKKERLKSRKLIDRVFSQGKAFNIPPFRVFYLREGVQLQAGFGVSARNFKKAVERNRVKRLTREAYRLQKHPLQDFLKQNNQPLALFFIYTGKDLPLYDVLFEKMGLIIQKLTSLANENNTAHP
jgi:ribonuclease P protein component